MRRLAAAVALLLTFGVGGVAASSRIPASRTRGDTRSGAINFFDPSAALGKGGRVRFFPDGKLAARSRAEVTEFFTAAFAAVTPSTKP